MLCEQCRKREATIKYVEVAGGVKTEHNLCAQCAGKLDLGQYSALFEGEFPLGKLLSGLLGIPDADHNESRFAGVVCPTCGTTYEDFVKNSRFGCEDCYSVFDPLIGENIRHLQGSEHHVGKRPAAYQAEEEKTAASGAAEPAGTEAPDRGRDRIRRLSRQLKDAVRREDYQEAARLRDEIRGLKEEADQDGEMV